MRLAAAALAVLGNAAATGAAASDRITDQQYLQANRCRALAVSETLGAIDPSAIDALLKAQGRHRSSAVMTMAAEAQSKATREARSADRRVRLIAERDASCATFLGHGAHHAGEQPQPKG